MLRVGAGCHGIANGFINCIDRHLVRVQFAILRVHSRGNHQRMGSHGHCRAQDHRIGRSISIPASQGFEQGAPLDFVIVQADDALTGSNVGMSQQSQQAACRVWLAERLRGLLPCRAGWRYHPGSKVALRQSMMQEVVFQVDHRIVFIPDNHPAGFFKSTNLGQFHQVAIAQRLQGGECLGRDCQHHSLLGFRKPDFPRCQPGIL